MDKKIEIIKKSSDFPIKEATGRQLSIWEVFGEDEPPAPENISFSVNCIDDWPLVSLKNNRTKDLNPIVTGANDLNVTAPPGYYRVGNKAKASFVGEQEWKLFIVLRRMALTFGGFQIDNKFSLSFTLRELSRFYKDSTGKTVKPDILKQRLEVLRTAVYQIQDKHRSAHFSLLRELYVTSYDDIKKDGNAKCFVMFDHLTEKTITTGHGVLIDYDLACKLPHLGSWLYTKLERAGLESGITAGVPYKLWLKDTLYRVGLDNSEKSIATLKKESIKAFTHLIEIGILKSIHFKDKNSTSRGRPKLLDSEISLIITTEFETRIRAKLFSTKQLRSGKSTKIKIANSYPSSPTKLKKLKVIKESNSCYVGHYEREDDRRAEDSNPPTEAEWRENDRRYS
ncbi:MAG: hypothetical protein O2897_01710 [bacterium]|nr:hypothetical protein [bacterium]